MIAVAVGYETYLSFAKKYKIHVTKGGKKKTIKEISKEIKDYEIKNKPKNGLYY